MFFVYIALTMEAVSTVTRGQAIGEGFAMDKSIRTRESAIKNKEGEK